MGFEFQKIRQPFGVGARLARQAIESLARQATSLARQAILSCEKPSLATVPCHGGSGLNEIACEIV